MRVFREEVRKLASTPMVAAFAVLCLAFNLFLMATAESNRPLFNAASAAAQELGQRVDDAFVSGLAARAGIDAAAGEEAVVAAMVAARVAGEPVSDETVLLAAALGMENVFDGYDAGELAAYYGERLAASPTASAFVERKYALLQERIDHLALTGAAMDFYAGPATFAAHSFLFGTLMPAVIAEGALVAMLGIVYLLGCEQQMRTAAVVYASRTGRRLVRAKVAAGMTAGLACYALLAGATLAVFTLLYDCAGVWGASVSSQFNVIMEGLTARPFITWADFTVAQYLAASLALGAVIVAACGLVAAVAGAMVRGAYRAALVAAAVLVGALTASLLLADAGCWVAATLFDLLPVRIWIRSHMWFTDGGTWTLVPWQEVVGALAGTALLGVLLALIMRMQERKDLVS